MTGFFCSCNKRKKADPGMTRFGSSQYPKHQEEPKYPGWIDVEMKDGKIVRYYRKLP
jgi:major membrane immunogen (membrane-anchored lipoprotein)